MNRLTDIHRRLLRLGRARTRFHRATAYSAVLSALLAALAVAFPIDWYFQRNMDVWQRLFLLALCAAVTIWAFRRFARPWLRGHETELDLALMVERQEHVDSDLVAALEFEWPEAPAWGSVQLEEAVIEQVAVQGPRFKIMENLPRRELRRRTKVLAAAVAVWVVLALLVPAHVLVFLKRLCWLSPEHYPTRTHIDAITVAGEPVDMGTWCRRGGKPIHVRYGQPVTFTLRGSDNRDELPAEGTVELVADKGRARLTLALQQSEKEPGTYSGQLPRLVDAVSCQFDLGDAWTDPGGVTCTQLPVIDLEPEVIPPAYASHNGDHPVAIPRGMRQFSVPEGSEVRMKVRADKVLKEVVLTLDDKPFQLVRDESSDPTSQLWVSGEEETPLGCVVQPTRYSVQVTDFEEQQLERPLEGVIRVQPDLPPRVAAVTRTPFVVPAGAPTIYLRAVDDHALARIWMTCEISHGKEGARWSDSNGGPVRTQEVRVYDMAAGEPTKRDIAAEPALNFAPLGVTKGDMVKVTVWAKDFRGRREGKASSAEPLVFQVTDELGVLAHLAESDKLTAGELKTMVEKELGIGQSR
jgi:hypothetical protein